MEASEPAARGPTRGKEIGEPIDLAAVRDTIHSSILALIASAIAIVLLVLLQQKALNPPWEEVVLGFALGWIGAMLWQRYHTR
jgi:hypothetical protein